MKTNSNGKVKAPNKTHFQTENYYSATYFKISILVNILK